jgi:hypothetical protein
MLDEILLSISQHTIARNSTSLTIQFQLVYERNSVEISGENMYEQTCLAK